MTINKPIAGDGREDTSWRDGDRVPIGPRRLAPMTARERAEEALRRVEARAMARRVIAAIEATKPDEDLVVLAIGKSKLKRALHKLINLSLEVRL